MAIESAFGSTSEGGSCRLVDVESIRGTMEREEQKRQIDCDHLVDSDTVVTWLKSIVGVMLWNKSSPPCCSSQVNTSNPNAERLSGFMFTFKVHF